MPDTTNYMVLGYAIVTIILIGLVVYLVLKRRRLETEFRKLEALEAEGPKEPVISGGTAGRESAPSTQTPAAHPR